MSGNPVRAAEPDRSWQMAGYLLVPNERVPDEYGGGFSMYVAAWPLLERYPGNRFQTGLFGTWMHPIHEQKPGEKFYTDIEGGLGWWRDTRFATETPKFIMGGVALNFRAWANGPGAGKGRDWNKPQGKYAVVQLSPNILWPPDGLNLKQGTCGELFGYGYLPLPLTEPKTTTAGKEIPTGNQCWTLFINAGNYKGPITFFAPYFWSESSLDRPDLAEMFLDVQPSNPNRALQMETQYIPAAHAIAANGTQYARVAPTFFPASASGESMVVHRVTSYKKSALWDQVENWFAGGLAASGEINAQESVIHQFPGHGGATWRIYHPNTDRDDRAALDWQSFAQPTAMAKDTFGYRWQRDQVGSNLVGKIPVVTLPEYYRLGKGRNGKDLWLVTNPKDVPAETGLAKVEFGRSNPGQTEPYVTPEEADSSWKSPGPVAGPFKAYPGDGSEVTYYWYRFADQPAILNADLTSAEREQLQQRVELLHRNWTKDRNYLPPPRIGSLADIDPNLIVTPPKGYEYGYVPIVTRQGAKE